jgi:hypothetical protein
MIAVAGVPIFCADVELPRLHSCKEIRRLQWFVEQTLGIIESALYFLNLNLPFADSMRLVGFSKQPETDLVISWPPRR